MTKILVDVDDRLLSRAAARLGTKTKKDTIGRALELAAQDGTDDEVRAREWDEWADDVAKRLSDVDWDKAWR